MRLTLLRATMLIVVVATMAIPGSRALFAGNATNPGNTLTAASSFTPAATFRVTTYELTSASGFTGTSHNLTLNQDLAPDYFVLLRGAAGDYTTGGDRSPAQDYARVDRDPFGNLNGTTAANQIRLDRGSGGSTWSGQVTVVECLVDCAASGFRLVKISSINLAKNKTSKTHSGGGSWTDLNQVALYGGSLGGGMTSTDSSPANHITGWARIFPSGSATVNIERQVGGSGTLAGNTRFTVYVIEWGTEWTIQRATVTGSSGGEGIDSPSEYDTAPIAPVSRVNSFVIGYGMTSGSDLSQGWEGTAYTLGDGVAVNAVESVVAVGSESPVSRTTEVYVHTHPELSNQHQFGPDGAISGVSGTQAVAAGTPDRFALFSNSSDGSGHEYPRSIVWGTFDSPTVARWQRSRSGNPGAFWLQVPDFGNIGN